MNRLARIGRAALATLLLAACAAPARAQTAEERQVLDAIRKMDHGQLSVSEADGRFLRVMAVNAGAKRAIEIGGAFGYSAIWIAMGLRETGGHLTSFEADAARAKVEAENVRRAGLADVVTVVAGDAFRQIPKLDAGIDFVFLDAWKRDYKRFLDLLLPRLRPRGVLLAHNVVNKRAEMSDFLDAVEHDPNLFTAIVSPASEGMSVTVRIR